jgi:hypothetical protein
MEEAVQIPKEEAQVKAIPAPKQVRVVVVNMLDRTVDDRMLDDLSFHYRAPGDKGEPKHYKLKLNEEQVLPVDVAEHLKTLGYDQYRMHETKDPATGRVMEAYPVRVGKKQRFMVTIVGDA